MAGAGFRGERQKELKNTVLISRIRSDTAATRDGGFAFSRMRDGQVTGEVGPVLIWCAGSNRLHNLPSVKMHQSRACLMTGTFSSGKDKGRPSGL